MKIKCHSGGRNNRFFIDTFPKKIDLYRYFCIRFFPALPSTQATKNCENSYHFFLKGNYVIKKIKLKSNKIY